jgi:hypothetical protein
MSDATPYKPSQWRKNRGSKVSLDGLPSAEELAQQTPEQADRYPLYTPKQLETETRTVRLDITFGDVIQTRRQAEMIIAAMQTVILTTRQHPRGGQTQRVAARREAAACARALNILNGKQKAK